MPIGNVVVNVVDVGQGQCTFVEIYDQSTPATLLYTLLFDCGTNKESDVLDVNLRYVADKALLKNPVGFDCIFFSHSDSDHINKVYDVLELIDNMTPPTIGKVVFAGDRALYTKYGFNILDYIERKDYCATKNFRALPSNWTGFDAANGKYKYHLWTTPDQAFRVFPIAANALSEDPDWYENDEDVAGKTPEQKNRISLICQLDYAKQTYVICGDATNSTMCAVNNLFKKSTTIFDNNKMTTLPHHGSRRTAFAVPRGKIPDPNAILTVQTFANLLKSRYLTDSAFQKHRHPSLELMSIFMPVRKEPLIQDARLKEKNVHVATAYVDFDITLVPGFNFFIHTLAQQSFETKTNTFTTRYYDGWATCRYDLGTGDQWFCQLGFYHPGGRDHDPDGGTQSWKGPFHRGRRSIPERI